MPDVADVAPPTVTDAVLGIGRKTATLTFDEPIRAKLDGATFDLAEANVVAAVRDPYEPNVLMLTFDRVLADSWENVRLTIGGVSDQSPHANRVPAGTEVLLRRGGRGLPAEVATLVNDTALTDGYKLVFAADLEANGTFNAKGDSLYWANEAGGPAAFDRIAYFLQLDNGANYTYWVWTSMDAWTDDASTLGFPIAAKHATPASRYLTNLTVASSRSDATLVKGSGFNGFLEFWPFNYDSPKDWTVENQTLTWQFGEKTVNIFSYGDVLHNSGTYGCFQIHNASKGQTVFAINNWGADGGQLQIGMGNSTPEEGKNSLDWTHRGTGANFARRRLYAFVRPCSPAPVHPMTAVPTEVSSKVDVDGYRLLYKINLPRSNARINSIADRVSYHEIDNRAILAPNPARVGYYLKLVRTNGDEAWIWTAFDRPDGLHNLDFLSVPRRGTIQTRVANLDVATNVGGLTTGTDLQTGCIEFGGGDYSGEAVGGFGGDGGTFDYDDKLSGATSGYGCMQVHNWGARQTLWAYNHFNNGSKACLGIGNNPNGHADWTFADNAENDYASSELYVLVKYAPQTESESVAEAYAPKRAVMALDRMKICVTFPSAVPVEVAAAANWSLAAGGTRVKGSARSPGDGRDVIVTLERPVTGLAKLVFTWQGQAHEIAVAVPDAFAPPQNVAQAIPELDEYSLVNELHIADAVRYSGHGADYAVDESRFVGMTFDRVAYLLHLTATDGVDRWVWTSMDPFTVDLALLGVPTTWRTGSVFQTYVENLHVYGYSSDGKLPVKTGEFARGNIEFWPGNYGGGNALGIPGASDQFDWGDTIGADAYRHGHGSMQVCNYLEKEVVFSMCAFGRSENIDAYRAPSLGIGNDEVYENGIDWTHRQNANNYTTRALYVFVRCQAEPSAVGGEGPAFQVHPGSARCKLGEDCVLAFSAYAVKATRYQWRLDGVPLAGQTDAVLTLAGGFVEKAGLHTIDVVAYGDSGAFTVSRPGRLNVMAPSTVLFFR